MWGLAHFVAPQRCAYFFESHSFTHPALPCASVQWQ
jgi:hypothetical protein